MCRRRFGPFYGVYGSNKPPDASAISRMPTAHCSPLPQTGLSHVRMGRPFECCLARDDASLLRSPPQLGEARTASRSRGAAPPTSRATLLGREHARVVSSLPIPSVNFLLSCSHGSTGGNRADHHPLRRIGVYVSERDINFAKLIIIRSHSSSPLDG